MQMSPEEMHCAKCDQHRFAKNRGKTLRIDIAHNRQKLHQAEYQLDRAIDQANTEKFSTLKIIVGRGLIRDEIRRSLDNALWQKRIKDYRLEEHNAGAYILKMHQPKN